MFNGTDEDAFNLIASFNEIEISKRAIAHALSLIPEGQRYVGYCYSPSWCDGDPVGPPYISEVTLVDSSVPDDEVRDYLMSFMSVDEFESFKKKALPLDHGIVRVIESYLVSHGLIWYDDELFITATRDGVEVKSDS